MDKIDKTGLADWFPKPTVAKPKKTISDVPDYEWQVRHEISCGDGDYYCDVFHYFSTFKKAVAYTPDVCDCGCDRMIIALHCFIDDCKAYVVDGKLTPFPTGRKIPKQYQDQFDKGYN